MISIARGVIADLLEKSIEVSDRTAMEAQLVGVVKYHREAILASLRSAPADQSDILDGLREANWYDRSATGAPTGPPADQSDAGRDGVIEACARCRYYEANSFEESLIVERMVKSLPGADRWPLYGLTVHGNIDDWRAILRQALRARFNDPDAPNRALTAAPSETVRWTPAARWREEGKPDPHEKIYDCERSELCCGDMTDDEIANEVFLYNADIKIITAAKERIRWLSRRLVSSTAMREALKEAVEIINQCYGPMSAAATAIKPKLIAALALIGEG